MVICKICGKEYKNFIGLGAHIRVHNINSKEYYDKYLKKDPKEGTCKLCGKPTGFLNGVLGYSEHCSIKCSTNSEIVKNKYKNTCLEKYGEECFLLNKEVRKRIQNTNLKKYESKSPGHDKKVREKIKNTMLVRYNVEYPFQYEKFKQKSRETIFKRYGADNVSKLEIFQNKRKKTCLDRYGKEYPIQCEQIKEKIEKTCFRKYGVSNVSESEEIKRKIDLRFRTSFFNRLFNSNRLRNLVTPNFSLSDYSNVKNKYEWKCNKCGNVFLSNLDNGKIPRCLICFPKTLTTSHYESEIYNFLSSYNITNIIQNDRSIISPLELDIYLPDHKLAIEFNGLYWHSELNGKDKNYHLNKTLSCQEKGITLLHIFEDEWIEKQEIVKSIMLHKLGLTKNKIYARNCYIKETSNNVAKDFYFENHLQDYLSGYHLGLYTKDNVLISLITFGKPRFNKNYQYEILRFCSKIHYSVIGSLSKLLSYFIKNKKPDNIITYSDLRYGIGIGYKNFGFKLLNRSDPNYFYTKSGFERESRLKYQKHKLSNELEIFDPTLTEWENMQLNNFDRIWDCGNLVFEWK